MKMWWWVSVSFYLIWFRHSHKGKWLLFDVMPYWQQRREKSDSSTDAEKAGLPVASVECGVVVELGEHLKTFNFYAASSC